MKLILTSSDIYTTNGGSRLVWHMPLYLMGRYISLNSITLIGHNVSLYGLAYIMRDDGSYWSTNFQFESTENSVQCINCSDQDYKYKYNMSDVVFNLYDKQIEPVQRSLIYDDIKLELTIYPG